MSIFFGAFGDDDFVDEKSEDEAHEPESPPAARAPQDGGASSSHSRRRPREILDYPWPGHPDQSWWSDGWPDQHKFETLFTPDQYFELEIPTVKDSRTPENMLHFLNYVIYHTVLKEILKTERGRQIGKVIAATGEPKTKFSDTAKLYPLYPYLPNDLHFMPQADSSVIVKFKNLTFENSQFVDPKNLGISWEEEVFYKLLFEPEVTDDIIKQERESAANDSPIPFHYWKINSMWCKEYRDKEFVFLVIMFAILKDFDLPDIPRWITDKIEFLMTSDLKNNIDLKIKELYSSRDTTTLDSFTIYKNPRTIDQLKQNLAELKNPRSQAEKDYKQYIEDMLARENAKEDYEFNSAHLKSNLAIAETFINFSYQRSKEIKDDKIDDHDIFVLTDMEEDAATKEKKARTDMPSLKEFFIEKEGQTHFNLTVYEPTLWRDALYYFFKRIGADAVRSLQREEANDKDDEDVYDDDDRDDSIDLDAVQLKLPIRTQEEYVREFMKRITKTLFKAYNDARPALSFETLCSEIAEKITNYYSKPPAQPVPISAVPPNENLKNEINKKLFGTEYPDVDAVSEEYKILFNGESYEYIPTTDLKIIRNSEVVLNTILKFLKIHRSSGVIINLIVKDVFYKAKKIVTPEFVKQVAANQRCLQLDENTIKIPFNFCEQVENKPFSMQDWQTSNLNQFKKQQLKGAGVFIADGMGMGKTVSAIACVLECCKNTVSPSGERTPRQGNENVNILIVVKKSTIPQWLSEVNKYTGISTESGMICQWPESEKFDDEWLKKNTEDGIKIHLLNIQTYTRRTNSYPRLGTFAWDGIIVDEAHDLRRTQVPTQNDPDSQSLKLFTTLCLKTLQKRGMVVLMSGTPIINGAINLSAYANMVCPLALVENYEKKYEEIYNTMNSVQAMQRLGNNKGVGEKFTIKDFRECLNTWLIKTERPADLFPRLSVYPAPMKGPNEEENSRLDIDALNLNRSDEYLSWQPSDASGSIRRNITEFDYTKELVKKLGVQLKTGNVNYARGESLTILRKMVLASIDPRLVRHYPVYKHTKEEEEEEINDEENYSKKGKKQKEKLDAEKEAKRIITNFDILKRPSSTMTMIGQVVEQLMKDVWKSPNKKPKLPHPKFDNDPDTFDTLSPDVFYKKLDNNRLQVTTEVPADLTRKVLVFSLSKLPLYVVSEYLHEKLKTSFPDMKKPSVFHGGISLARREQLLKNFKTDPNNRIMCMTTGSGAVGLNITEASAVVFLDRWWTQSIHDQAVARACRPGQTRDVRVAYVIPRNTIGRLIEEVVYSKKDEEQALLFDDLNSDPRDPKQPGKIAETLVERLKAYYNLSEGAGPSGAAPPDEAGPSGAAPPPPAAVPSPWPTFDLTGSSDDEEDAKRQRIANNRQSTFDFIEELKKLNL